MKVYEGNLKLNNNMEYMVIRKGEVVEIGKELEDLLMDRVHIKLTNTYNNEILFDNEGILHKKNDLGGDIWRLWIDDICLDEILFDISNKVFNKTVIEYEVVDSKVKYKNNLEVMAK